MSGVVEKETPEKSLSLTPPHRAAVLSIPNAATL